MVISKYITNDSEKTITRYYDNGKLSPTEG